MFKYVAETWKHLIFKTCQFFKILDWWKNDNFLSKCYHSGGKRRTYLCGFFLHCVSTFIFFLIKSRWIFRHQKVLLEILNTVLLMLTSWGLLTRGIIIKHNLLFHQRKLCLPEIWSPTFIKPFRTSDTYSKQLSARKINRI